MLDIAQYSIINHQNFVDVTHLMTGLLLILNLVNTHIFVYTVPLMQTFSVSTENHLPLLMQARVLFDKLFESFEKNNYMRISLY